MLSLDGFSELAPLTPRDCGGVAGSAVPAPRVHSLGHLLLQGGGGVAVCKPMLGIE